jgi:hypothetical protein
MRLKIIYSVLVLTIISAFTEPESGSTNNANNSASANEIYDLGLHELPQVIFWRKIMNLHKDSCLVNVHHSRTILATMHAGTWYGYQPEFKGKILDSFKRIHNIIDSPRIVGTMGKSFFYNFEKVAPNIPLGISEFEKNGVDGWYAKAILLIESPNQLQKSPAGAYGPFQLMKGVAKNYGLKVNKKIDERKNFNRSAYAASMLIKSICIPYAKMMLDEKGIAYNEKDLWFRLFVMHIYNAGAGNVKLALSAIPQPSPGMGLIQQMWVTSAGRFQTSSQNYSQLILAAFLEYDERIDSKSKK